MDKPTPNPVHRDVSPRRPQTIDLRPAARVRRSAQQVAATSVTPQVGVDVKSDELLKNPKVWLASGVAYDLLLITFLGYLALGSSLVNWAFLVYLVMAFVLRIASQRIFRSALICLVLIPLASALKHTTIANNFAIFAFYFLAIGVFRAMYEQISETSE